MQIRCASCGSTVPVADTGVLPPQCPHCKQAPVPERLGRFKVVRLLAAGGMGEVYLGEHEQLGSRVALKLLPTPAGSDAAAVCERFRREAKLTAAIDHPGVVQVLDQATDQGRMYLVLELVDGRSLRSRLREGPLPVAEAVRVAAAAADVLGAAHRAGVVHRDVKPENVMLCRDGRVRVLDFGIARALQDQEPLTRTGEILGTPEYMAPEQLLDEASAVDARTDVHALAVLCYELLTGRSPFAGSSLFAALKLVESLVPPPPSRLRSEVPAALDAVVLRGLAKTPAERFADGAAFAAALRGACPEPAPTVPRRGANAVRIALGALLLLVAAAFGLGAWFVHGLNTAVQDFGNRLGNGLAAVAGEGLRVELDRLLRSDALTADERERAHALLTLLGPPTEASGLLTTGRTLLRVGAFHEALQRLDRSAQSDPAARPDAAVAWHCVHTLLPACIGAPPWFACVDGARRDRLLGLGDAAADAAAPPLLLACRELATGKAAAAWQRLAGDEAAWSAGHAAIALLAARAACADPAAFAAVAQRVRARFAEPAVQLAATTTPAAAAALLQQLAAEQDATGADRWLFELVAALAQPSENGALPPRARSAAELAWLQGGGGVAPFWPAAARLLAAMRGQPLRADEALRLQSLFAAPFADEAPAGELVRALALLGSDPTAARRALRAASLPAEPALAPFAHWLAADDECAAVIASVLRTGRAAERPLPDGDAPPTAFAHALLALAGDRPEARREHWRRLLARPWDDGELASFAAADGALADLEAVLAEHAADAPTPPGLIAALRMCCARGGTPGALRERFAAEITDGVR